MPKFYRNPTALTLLAERHCPQYRWNRRRRRLLTIWHENKLLLLATSMLIVLDFTCVLGKFPEHVGHWLAALGATP